MQKETESKCPNTINEAEMIIDFGGCSWDIRQYESHLIPSLSVNRCL